MSESTGIGSTVHIAAAVPETNRVPTTYVSLSYTEIGGVDNFGDHGPEGQVVPYTPLKTGIERQLVGAIKPGNFTINCAIDPLDAGQIAVKAAAGTRRLYPMKIVAADGADSNDTDTVVYFGVRILSAKPARGQNGVAMLAINCAIDTPEHEIASVAVSGGS